MNRHVSCADADRLRDIAQLTGCPLEHVRELHEDEWLLLEQQARIRDFLPLLAMKHVWQRCRDEAGQRQARAAQPR